MNSDEIKNVVAEESDYVLGLYHKIHKHPELGMHEYDTAALIRSELDKMGIKWFEATETGTVGVIEGSGEGKTLMLRADIDALPVQEANTHDYVSEIPGKMHACGHDAHTVTLLGAARVLKEKFEGKFPGKIYCLFQPGEETTIGAHKVVESGALNGIDAAYGQHVWSYIDTGRYYGRSGGMMAGARMFTIKVKGRGGHGSELNKTIDPVIACSAIVMALQGIVSHNVSPKESVTLCTGYVQCGTKENIVPEDGTIGGSIRFFSDEMDKYLCQRITEVAELTAKSYQTEAIVSFTGSVPALVTDPALEEIAMKAAEKVMGDKDKVLVPELVLGSEDFSEYRAICPVAFGFIGCGNKEKGCTAGHHSPFFCIDEDALQYATAMYVQYAVDYFNSISE